MTTIQKFTEDLELLTDRANVICISDEAHRSQINLDQKVKVTAEGVERTYGFAKYLHDSLPNATYVGFTGTPVDGTIEVFGPVVDAYTMTEDGYFPAYHMNKEKWLSIQLGKPELDDAIKDLLSLSYELTAPKKRNPKSSAKNPGDSANGKEKEIDEG